MRTRLLIMIVGVFVFLSTKGYGATVGSIDPAGWTLGLASDNSERDVKGDKETLGNLRNSRLTLPSADIQQLKIDDFDGNENIHRIGLRGSYGIGDGNFSVFVKLGVARLSTTFSNPIVLRGFANTASNTLFGGKATHGDMSGNGDSGFFYGLGAQATVYHSTAVRVAVAASILQQKYDTDYTLFHASGDGVNFLGEKSERTLKSVLEEAETSEIELAAIISGPAAAVTPYGGLKLSFYKTEYDGKTSLISKDDTLSPVTETVTDSFTLETEPESIIDFFFGVDFALTPQLGLNTEVRVGGETGATAAFEWIF